MNTFSNHKHKAIRFLVLTGIFLAILVLGYASFFALRQLFEVKALFLGRVNFLLFLVLTFFVVIARGKLPPPLAALCLSWCLLDIPSSLMTLRPFYPRLGLTLACIWVVTSYCLRGRTLASSIPSLVSERTCFYALIIYGCFLFNALLLYFLGMQPLSAIAARNEISPFPDAPLLLGSQIFLFLLVGIAYGKVWGSAYVFKLSALILSSVALIQFLCANHVTFSFHRDFSPMRILYFSSSGSAFLLFSLLALMRRNTTGTSVENQIKTNFFGFSELLCILALLLSFDPRIYLAIILYAFAYSYRRGFNTIESKSLSLHIFLALMASGMLLFLWLPDGIGSLSRYVQQIPFPSLPSVDVLNVWAGIIPKIFLGLGPAYQRVFDDAMVPGITYTWHIAAVAAFGGLPLLIALVTLFLAFVRNTRAHFPEYLLACLPFFISNSFFLTPFFLVGLSLITGIFDQDRTPFCSEFDLSKSEEGYPIRRSVYRILVVLFSIILCLLFLFPLALFCSRDILHEVAYEETKDVPETFVYALLIEEDSKFFQHTGFDLSGVFRSFTRNINKVQYAEGASTISMQLIKNAYLKQDKTIFRKLIQSVMTLYLEASYSKSDILRIYIADLDFGLPSRGIQAAAKKYFAKSAEELSPEESLRLVLTIPNPKRYNPGMPDNDNIRKKLVALSTVLESDWYLLRKDIRELLWRRTELYYK